MHRPHTVIVWTTIERITLIVLSHIEYPALWNFYTVLSHTDSRCTWNRVYSVLQHEFMTGTDGQIAFNSFPRTRSLPQEFGLLLHPVHPLDLLCFSGFVVWSQQAANKRRSILHQELWPGVVEHWWPGSSYQKCARFVQVVRCSWVDPAKWSVSQLIEVTYHTWPLHCIVWYLFAWTLITSITLSGSLI
jgi:hypothetical protein